MKKILSMLLIIALLVSCVSGCGHAGDQAENNQGSQTAENDNNHVEDGSQDQTVAENTVSYTGLDDPELLQHVEDAVYSELVATFPNEDYIIDNVNASYVSKEYLEELSYNSRENIFFGYTLKELNEQFHGTRYVFTLGENNETVVQQFQEYDNTYEKAFKNIVVGTGVILICCTVSVVASGTGLTTVSVIFAASAKTAAELALTSGAIGGTLAGITEAVRTHDFDAAVKSAVLVGSDSFKWGAVSGALAGGASKLGDFWRTSKAVNGAEEVAAGTVDIPNSLPRWEQAELRALNSEGGYEQMSFLNGEAVPFGTQGATRPDVVKNLGDHLEAIEVKCYDLENPSSVNTMIKELQRQVESRVNNLPAGSTQSIILDVTDRGFSEATCNVAKERIWEALKDIYPDIPIKIIGLV